MQLLARMVSGAVNFSSSAKICCLSGSFSGAASKTIAAPCTAGASVSCASMRCRSARIVFEQVDDRLQPLRQRCADFGRRLEHGDAVSRGGEQVSDAVTHQAAADYAGSLFLPITHLCLPELLELATMTKRCWRRVHSMTDPQRRNGHAYPSVGCLLVVADGHRRVLGRSGPAGSRRNFEKAQRETRSIERRLTRGIAAIDIHHLSGAKIRGGR